ncbi:amino acid ABC transporter ATP-binding/permease protein [Actibacterium ureilyticum]|uniref:amino acid ABC transporter ATP-binding/permease protein n=1 Tax=Actibacterium ureilyticum TaxID=1590614 RepID=UPI000BAB1D36|nr:ATP-binding cassette domain-containing protein [Actibacterium ureilyticum]
MKHLCQIMRLLLTGEGRAFARGFALAATVLVMGVALLALSGWFITAAAAAGLIGLGTVFNVFAPSAMVRFLALGRTAARYGERLATHDATLRALSRLRVRLLQGLTRAPYRSLERLRANAFLNRVTADIDALDGVALRLMLPGLAGLAVIAGTALVVWWLVDARVALVLALGYGLLPSVIFVVGQWLARRPSRRAESGMQALRSRLIDLIATRDELVVFGRMGHAQDRADAAARYHAEAQSALDRTETRMGAALDLAGVAVTALALGLGADLAQAGQITPAQAAIGVFAALALSETVAPVRRALTEIGRMIPAARRVLPALRPADAPAPDPAPAPTGGALSARALTARRGTRALFAPLEFTLQPGETIALTGRSGCGKSTVLLMAAGQIAPDGGAIDLGGIAIATLPEATRTALIAMVPQRHALIAGTIAENLRLADTGADDATLWAALRATCLDRTIRDKGGLTAPLGFRGAGLSGGEARRLVLARALLRRPRVLLLDEPTEGLDAPTARAVLGGIRIALPDAAILMAAHRPEETDFADRCIALAPPPTPR